MARVPVLARAGVQRIVNGPITYTPDGNPLLGPAFGLPGFWLACGLSFGITQAGGAGALPGGVDRRGAAVHRSLGAGPAPLRGVRDGALRGRPVHRHLRGRVRDRLPAGRPPAGAAGPDEPAVRPLPRRRRGLRRAERLGAAVLVRAARDGAARPAELPPDQLVRRGRPGGARRPRARGPARAVELREVRGPGSGRGGLARPALREPASSARPDRPLPAPDPRRHHRVRRDRHAARARALPGPERRGRRAATTSTGSGATRRRTASVAIENVTARWGVLILAGPRARDVLARVTDADLSNGAFPWLSRARDPGRVRPRPGAPDQLRGGARAGSSTTPSSTRSALYEALRGAGADLGLVDFGLRAMDSLRLEKAYRAWGADINTEVTPLEAGLERFVAFDKGDFIGRDALLEQRRDGAPEAPGDPRGRRARRRLLGERGRLGGRPRRGDHDLGRLRPLAGPEPGGGLRRRRGRRRRAPAWTSRSWASGGRPGSPPSPCSIRRISAPRRLTRRSPAAFRRCATSARPRPLTARRPRTIMGRWPHRSGRCAARLACRLPATVAS